MLCSVKPTLLTRYTQNRVVARAVTQQRPRTLLTSVPASAVPSSAPTSAPSVPKKAAQKSPAPTTTQAVVRTKKVKALHSLSPYNYFLKNNFHSIAALHPDKKGVIQLVGVISAAWIALSDKDRAPYVAAGAKSKKEVSEKRAVLKAQKKAAAIPLTAYSQFVKDTYPVVKAKNPGLKFTEAGKKVREVWLSLSEAEKAKIVNTQTALRDAWKAKQNDA